MLDFARLPKGERDDAVAVVALGMDMHPAIVEKDFWVCWKVSPFFLYVAKAENIQPPQHFEQQRSVVVRYMSVRGIELFRDALSGFEGCYALIGGSARERSQPEETPQGRAAPTRVCAR